MSILSPFHQINFLQMTGAAQSFVLLFLFLSVTQFSYAQEAQGTTVSKEALYWLKKAAAAPRQHNYRGTFVYYADDAIETSRIVHVVDTEGEYEKIEVLDGLARVVIRNNNIIRCYFPDSKTVVTERRWFRKLFPDFLPQPLENISGSYIVTKEKQDRIAGFDSQIIFLQPIDDLRYGHRIWVDIKTGLALKQAIVENERNLEQFSFVELEVGKELNLELLESNYPEIAENWENHNLFTSVLKERALEWQVKELPLGFKTVIEMRRDLVGKTVRVDHIVLTDGIATVSIFIRHQVDNHSSHTTGFLSNRGATNIYIRSIDNYTVTTVGEVPLKTVKLIGDAVFKRQRKDQ